MSEQVLQMKICRFQLSIVSLEPLILPSYKGSTFRGAFGNALKRVVCALRKEDCSNCFLKEKCIYAYIFETPPPSNTKIMRKYLAAPHPFVIEPPPEKRMGYKPGDEINFNLILAGRAIEYVPYFIYAFDEMGKIGIGKGRGKYELKEVSIVNISGDGTAAYKSVYDSVTKKIETFNSQLLSVSFDCSDSSARQSCLSLSFLTPTRLICNGSLILNLEFHILIRNLLRRLSLISYFHCDNNMTDWDFKNIIVKAEEIKVKKHNLKWYDWERYSARQDTRMKMGGFIGDIIFEGNISPFMQLINAGKILHVGKGTSFGLGKYEVLSLE